MFVPGAEKSTRSCLMSKGREFQSMWAATIKYQFPTNVELREVSWLRRLGAEATPSENLANTNCIGDFYKRGVPKASTASIFFPWSCHPETVHDFFLKKVFIKVFLVLQNKQGKVYIYCLHFQFIFLFTVCLYLGRDAFVIDFLWLASIRTRGAIPWLLDCLSSQ